MTPAQLHVDVVGLLDAVDAVRRRAPELSREYSTLEAGSLSVDELGPTVSSMDVLDAAKLALTSADDALLCVVDSIYDTMRHTSRLKEREA